MRKTRKLERDDFTEVGILFPTRVKREISNAVVLKVVKDAQKSAPPKDVTQWPQQPEEQPRTFITTVSTSGAAQ
jgi:hypothetical protein